MRVGEAGDGFSDGGSGFAVSQRLGDDAVGLAQEFEEGDEGVEARRQDFGGSEVVGAKSEFAQRAVVPVGGREEGEDNLAGRVGHGGFSRVSVQCRALAKRISIFPGGCERTEKQFSELFAAAGWKLNRIIPTRVPESIVEGIPA